MASNTRASLALFLALNLLFFALGATACNTCTTPIPKPTPTPGSGSGSVSGSGSGSGSGSCPTYALKLGVCANVLKLLKLKIGNPPKEPCCPLLGNLVDLEAAVCLCTAIKANVLGIINLNIPIDLSLLLNYCGKNVPAGFKCA